MSNYSPAVLAAARKLECEIDGLYFFRYFYKQRSGNKALISWHHHLINDALQQVIDGKIARLVICLPPGYTKTELASINFMARGLALNARARFMHLSFSDPLALQNSAQARDIVKSTPYQEMWHRELRDDTDSKKLWWTKEGGGVYATSMQGPVTGFRAGQMEPGFTGALIVDDPIKPDDVLTAEREKTNSRYSTTIKNRLAHEGVPIIVIMQRLHHNDLAGFLLKGGSGEKWHYLELPVHEFNQPLPAEYTHAIPMPYTPKDTVLWRYKHDEAKIEILKASPRDYQNQYKQRPQKGGGAGSLWSDQSIERARHTTVLGAAGRTVIAVDPSVTGVDGKSDECGIVAASLVDLSNNTSEQKQYWVRADYSDVMKPDEWVRKVIYAYTVHDADAVIVETNNGGDFIELTLRNAGFTGRVIKIHATKGKYLRAEPVAPLYNLGQVAHASGLLQLEAEMLDFNLGMDKSPNRVDALVYALTELSNPAGAIGW